MSIAELGGVSEPEMRVLMILRCAGVDGHCFEDSPFIGELRCQARRLEQRGLARIINKGRPNETAFITVKGLERSVEPERRAA